MSEQTFLNGRIALHPHSGTLSFHFPLGNGPPYETWTAVQGAQARVHYLLAGRAHSLTLSGPETGFGIGESLITLSHRDDQVHLNWTWTVAGNGLEGWLEVTNHGKVPINLERLDVLWLEDEASLRLPGPASDWRIYQNGWQSWTPAGVRRLADGPFPAPADEEYRRMHLPHGQGWHSEWVGVFAATEPEDGSELEATGSWPRAHLLLGFVSGAEQLAEITFDMVDQRACHIAATCHTDGVALDPGASVRSERLRVATGPDGWNCLSTWAERTGEVMRARVPDKTPTGWCTWYYYFGDNTAQDVYANLNAIRRHHLPLNLVMVDDGYQGAVGDWMTPNPERFTDLMAVATTIRREGRTPGIWTAPFGLADNSQTWSVHPDWAVRNEQGEPVLAWTHSGCPVYALDTTHPDAADWLYATFHTMRREWGYDAFKVDFLFAAALPGRRHDARATRAQAFRRGLTIIRDAIGDDAFLLGCAAPLLPAVGLVDGMRVGPDVSPSWAPASTEDLAAPATSSALRSSIARAFTQRRLWMADSGCLLVRPRGQASQLTLYEARTLATIITLIGGMLVDSDLLSDLPPARLAMLRQMLPPTEQVAHPFQFFEHDVPETLILPIERPWGPWWLAGLANWSQRTRPTRIDLAALGLPPGCYHVYDQWRAEYLGQTDSEVLLPAHRPHEMVLLLFKPATDRPEWLTSTFHLAAGAAEIVDVVRQNLGERRVKLVLHLEQRGHNFGRLVFTVPPGWVVLDAQVNKRRRSVNVRDEQARLVDMGFTLRDRAWVLVDFARV